MIAPPGMPFTASVGSAAPRPGAGRLAADPVQIGVGFTGPEEKTRVIAWLDAGLRPGRPGRLAAEYPLLFEPGSPATPITLFESGEPAAFCVLWPSRFQLSGGGLRTGLVSLVYTDPVHRRRGFARQVVQRAMEVARDQDLGLVLLWSDLEDFYGAQGFTRSGCETLLVVDAPVLSRALGADQAAAREPLHVERVQASDWPRIEALRRERPCFAERSNVGDRLARIPDLDVRVARGADGVVGFAMRGRGDDFEGVVHEWGGDPQAVLACCQAWLAREEPEAGFLLLSPRAMSPLSGALRRAGARVVRNPLAWFRIASLEAFASDLASVVPGFAELVLSRCSELDTADPRFRIERRTSGRSLDVSADELFGWLFGDVSEAALQRTRARLEPIVPEIVRAALPLPFFVWGLESI